MPYSSSLTDKEWETIAPLLLKKQKTRPPIWTKRQILDGVFYQLKNGCNWGDLPKDLPPYSTVFWHYKQWRSQSVFDQILTKLYSQVREQVKKKPKWTRLLIVDSQAVKNTCNAGVESKGFCHYKYTNEREFWGRESVPKSLIIKRHLAVDPLGLPFFTHCTKASVTDDQGMIELLSSNLDYFRAKPVNIPKITILLDHGYHPDTIGKSLQKLYPPMMTKIRFQLAPKPTKAEKIAQGKTGFIPVATRWVIERSNAWIKRCKSLVKNFERTLDHATAKLNLCFIRLMLKRLAHS